jgi:integrase/recombinase XerD
MTVAEIRHRLDSYLELRKTLGFKILAEERYLNDFVRHLDGRLSDPLQMAQLAVDWSCSTGKRGPATQARCLSFTRRFLMHLQASFPEITIPGANLLAGSIRSTPHIFSASEIRVLLQAARSLKSSGSLRPITYFTLIGLVASCGLRANEAIQLRIGDVVLDSAPPRLYVNQTKFRKSRLVPLHPTTAEIIRHYAAERRRFGGNGSADFFFVSEKGTQLNYRTVARTFVTLARQTGIRAPQGERGASLHDLRHTFAVNRIIAWYQQRVDVQSRLPELSVYMGHVIPEHTYWYLTATPELLSLAAERFERHHEAGRNL